MSFHTVWALSGASPFVRFWAKADDKGNRDYSPDETGWFCEAHDDQTWGSARLRDRANAERQDCPCPDCNAPNSRHNNSLVVWGSVPD